MPYRLIGADFTPPDVVAKVTGRAKYVEDFRVDGMLICRLYVSPFAHARVTAIRTEAARRIRGVVAILTRRRRAGAAGRPAPALDQRADLYRCADSRRRRGG